MKSYEMFINGEFIGNGSRKMTQVINPANEEVISEIPMATEADVATAVDAAYEAQISWAKKPAIERAGYIREIAAKIRENAEFFAKIISEEQGKILGISRVEVMVTAEYMDYMSEWARRIEGEVIESDRPNESIIMYKKPIGVAAGILPWNFPFYIIARKMAPALIAGNTIVVKPSNYTPNCAFEFAKVVAESSLPRGVFNLVSGAGSMVGNALATNPKVGIISMTGSVETGTKIMEAAAKNITKVSLELGGKAPTIIMADADLDLAVNAVAQTKINNAGQVCNTVERLYVQESIAEEFVRKLVDLMSTMRYGEPLKDDTLDMGPMIDQHQVDSVDECVKKAVAEGAKVILGGERASVNGKGFFYKPTILINCTQDMEIMHKEIFGPVLPIATFKTFDEVMTYANDCEYGLTSSIFTQNVDYMMRACNELKCGETYVNREHMEAIQGYHQGIKKSGIGGDDGKHGFEEFLQPHVCYIQYKS